MRRYTLHLGDNRELMAKMKPNTVDAIVTDPPYGLEFMGKDWDRFSGYFSNGNGGGGPDGMSLPRQRSRNIKCDECGKWVYDHEGRACTCGGVRRSQMRNFEEWSYTWAKETYRVAKPGAHLLAFGGSRTFHRLAVAIEDAGWEIRDTIMWVYGSGFPKSLDVSKAIDKAAGAEREVVGRDRYFSPGRKRTFGDGEKYGTQKGTDEETAWETAPATPEAAAWQGFGTALKPAHEPIIVARKPLEGTVAANVLKWGTGAINVDGCRVEGTWERSTTTRCDIRGGRTVGGESGGIECEPQSAHVNGRWPANLVHDGSAEVLRLFPNVGKSAGTAGTGESERYGQFTRKQTGQQVGFGDTGSAARFFYCAKASKQDRDEGLEGWTQRQRDDSRQQGNPGGDNPRNRGVNLRTNFHPTVKPTSLMRWLVRLVTPPGGTVLDPFMGSGSTGKAAMLEGFDFLGMELDPEYLEIARARIEFAIADQAFGLFDLPELDMAAD